MISFLKGKIEEINIETINLDVNGVGYELNVPKNTFKNLKNTNDNIKFYTYLSVREDDMSLYGFLNKNQLKLFKKLMKVSGIGPKLSLGIVSAVTLDELVRQIHNSDIKKLCNLKGVGKKTAQRMILELKDKLDISDLNLELDDLSVENNEKVNEIKDALESLGFNKSKISKVLEKIDYKNMSVEEVVKISLKSLSTL